MKKVFFLLILFCCNVIIQAQTSDEDLRVYFSDAEFFIAEEEYLDALYDYLELYNNGFENNANINYRIGICYLNIPGQKDKSIEFLLKAIKNTKTNNRESEFREEKAPLDAYLYLGNAYRVNNNPDKAIELYEKYKKLLPSSDKANIEYIDKQIQACNSAIQFMESPVDIIKSNLGEVINTNSSDFKAVISGDGKTLLYMNELPFYDGVFFSQLENGKWTEPVNITPQIQSDGNQYVSSVSYDGTQLFLTMEDNFNSDIYVSTFKDGQWTKSTGLPKTVNSKYWESHASISKNGRSLYFSSNRRRGYGVMDIFKSVMDEENEWSEPTNLGNIINTALSEDTPFITEDEKSLYFSSQGHNSMGGYDIFVSRLDEEGNWTEPQNLGYPINTTDDNLFYFPWNNGQVAYIALYEQDGYGKEDIYSVRLITEEVVEEPVTEIIEASVVVEDTPEKQIIEEEKTKDIAEISEEMQEVELTPVIADDKATEELKAEDVAEISEEEKSPVVSDKEVIEEELITRPAAEFTIKPVYFKFDDYSLSEESGKELDRIISLLNDYSNLEAKLSGHTDSEGTVEYNQKLSEKRALSALNYMISKGINSSRLGSAGFGETKAAAINKNPDGSDNPEGRGLNRRVEFEIIGVQENNITIKKVKIPEQLRFEK